MVQQLLEGCRGDPRAPASALGSATTMEGGAILAVVGETPITAAEVDRRARRAPFDLLRGGCEDLAAVTLDDLIDEELLCQEAARRGIVVGPTEVDAALSNMARALRFDAIERLLQFSEQRGTTRDELRERVRRRELAERAFAAALPSVHVTTAEMRSLHRWHALKGSAKIQVLFVEATRTDDASYAHARALAADLAARARDGEEFCKLAEEFGSPWLPDFERTCEWPRKSNSSLGDVVWSARSETAFSIARGSISAPLEEAHGIFIFKVVDAGPSFEESRGSLEQEAATHAIRRSRIQLLAALRRRTPPRLDPRVIATLSRVRQWRLSRQLCIRPG